MQRQTLLAVILTVMALVAKPVFAQGFVLPVHAHFTGTVNPIPKQGKSVTVTVQAAIDSGWHIYSLVPSPGGPFPTSLANPGPGWKIVGKPVESPATHVHDPNFGVNVAYHTGSAMFQEQCRVTKVTAKPTVVVHFQTCSDSECLPPAQATVLLQESNQPAPAIGIAPASPAGHPAANTPSAQPSSPSWLPGLGLFLLAAFGAGLLTLLTPCVFPMIPITLTSFIKQAEGDRSQLVRISFGYALGIVLLYVGLGIAVTALTGVTGLSRLGASPWINLLIFALFVVFALSFFETVAFSLPVNLGALQSLGRRHGGIAGLALLGIAFVLASFTCVAPFIGTLIVVSANGSALRLLLGLLAFALAFASPFFLFAFFPQWVSRIPRSGSWLSRVKGVLGFLELAASLKFLSNADLYWQWKILTQPVLLALWMAIFVCAVLYLLGPLRIGAAEADEPAARPRVPWGRDVTAALFALAAGYCVWGLSGRPIPLLQTFLPPAGYGGAAAASPNALTWMTSYPAALQAAKSQNLPLLIDFTGNFCTNCRYNENNVFPASVVQSQLNHYVRVQLYTDGQGDAANQNLEVAKFRSVALPLYGVIDPQTGQPVTQIAGTLTPSRFARFLSQARAVAVSS